MTESKHQGDLNIVRAEVDALAQSLEEAGFCVKRRKIEARYDAQGVPETDSDTRGLPATCYFEYHTAINLSGEKDQLKALRKCATPHGAHVSRNARKIGADGQEERFVTLRVYRAGRETAEKRYGSLVADLRKSGMQIADERREFTVYDSNIDLDRGWLSR